MAKVQFKMVNGVYVKVKSDNMEDRDYRNDCFQLEKVIKDQQKELAELRKQLTPIPVEEKLPVDDEDVIAYLQTGRKIIAGYDNSVDLWIGDIEKNEYVIHWIPIPQINNK